MRFQVLRIRVVFLVCSMVAGYGCAHRAAEETAAPQMPAGQQAAEQAYLEDLREKSGLWNSAVVSRIEAVQKDIDAVDRAWSAPLDPAEQEFLSQRKQLLVDYQAGLEAVHQLQLQLRQKETAQLREPVYRELISQYLRCLSLEDSLKQLALLRSEKTTVLDDMRQLFLQENFAGVVDRYTQQAERFPGRNPGPGVQLYYMVALIRLGYTAEALQAASRLSSDLPLVDCANAALLAEAAGFLLKNGQTEDGEALRQTVLRYYQSQQEAYARMQAGSPSQSPGTDYTAVQETLAQAAELFAQGGRFSEVYRLCNDALALCPDRPCQREVQSTLEGLVARTAADVDRKLNQVDLLVQQGRQEDARQLLSTLEPLLEEGTYPPLLVEKRARIQQRKAAVFGTEASWQAEAEQQKFDEAEKLLANQKYEEAIAAFSQFGGGVFAEDAAGQKRIAVDELARANRTRAGHLFLQARQTADPQMKKKYLLESYTLLKDTLLQYPENQYADKIRRNLEGVQTEINRLYPGDLLLGPAPSGGQPPDAAAVPSGSEDTGSNP